MNNTASVKTLKKEGFVAEFYLDSFNKRIRVDDYAGKLQMPSMKQRKQQKNTSVIN